MLPCFIPRINLIVFQQLAIGSAIIVFTVIIQVLLLILAIYQLTRISHWLSHPTSFTKTSIVMVLVVLWTLFGLTVNTWIWASIFVFIGALPSLDAALYFATVAFTTLGFGDITLDRQWRLLSSLTAVNGLLIFGLNTAFLVQFFKKTRSLHISHKHL